MSTLPELHAFSTALEQVDPDARTACANWSAHDLVAHLVAGVEEVLRNLRALSTGGIDAVPATRTLEAREAPYRSMPDEELRGWLVPGVDSVLALISELCSVSPDRETVWTGRTMPVRAFATHVRSELAIHRWDLVGHDAIGTSLLADVDLTRHAVNALGGALLKGGVTATEALSLHSPGMEDVVVSVNGIRIVPAGSCAGTVIAASGHPGDRLLLLWGRFAPRVDGLCAPAGNGAWNAARAALAGY